MSQKFFQEMQQRYRDACDYSQSEYLSNKKKINVRCTKHDVIFGITPANHRKNKGCPACRREGYGQHLKITKDDFIRKARVIHGDRYDYSQSTYKGYTYPITIKCSIHGEFDQLVKNHLEGADCPRCAYSTQGTHNLLSPELKEEYFEKCRILHNNFYDYSKSDFTRMMDKISIVCPVHGEFRQRALHHRKGQGCPVCGQDRITAKSRLTKDEFIERGRLHFGEKYGYDQVEDFDNIKARVTIVCPDCGPFQQFVESHIRGHGCRNCTVLQSKWELEIRDFLLSEGVDDIIPTRRLIPPQEIDLYSPSRGVAVECNGNYYHSEFAGGKRPTYHLRKTLDCRKQNVFLIQIFEDEWRDKQEIVKSILQAKFGTIQKRIFARKCSVRNINKDDKAYFLTANHLMGTASSRVRLGLFHGEQLVSVMTFIPDGKHQWNLNRFSSLRGWVIPGGAEKLFRYFVRAYNPQSVISLSDLRWSAGGLYHQMGFEQVDQPIRPTYTWTGDYLIRQHKMKFRKTKLADRLPDYNPALTEKENMLNAGFDRIWDCGHLAFLWTDAY